MMSNNKVKILVIDDDRAILNALEMFLKLEGYEVETATGYHNYFKQLKSNPPLDLIILDILLSEENGCQIARQLKADKKTAKIPIVMISAHPNGEAMAEAAGAESFLAKPFEMDVLLDTLDELVRQTA